MVTTIRLDQLTAVTESNTATLVPLENVKTARNLTQNILVINLNLKYKSLQT